MVLVVGHEQRTIGKREEEYWIIKNCWGERWADRGSGKINCKPYSFKAVKNSQT